MARHAYRGYLITSSMCEDEWYVVKDGTCVSRHRTALEAEEAVDSLVLPEWHAVVTNGYGKVAHLYVHAVDASHARAKVSRRIEGNSMARIADVVEVH